MLIQACAEALDAAAGLFELLSRCCVGDAEIGRQAEGRAVNNGDALFFQERRHYILVSLERLALSRGLADQTRAGRIDVERALRRRALDAFRLVQHGDDEIAPLFEALRALLQEILRPVQRLDAGPLADARGVRRGLRLQRRHRLDETLRPRAIADAPPRHGVGLRDAVHGERA